MSDKSKSRKIKSKTKEIPNPQLKSYPMTTGCISTFILILSTIILYDHLYLIEDHEIDFEAIKTELNQNVHNQSEALDVIFKSFEVIKSDQSNLHIINLVGSTGVGKTFVANILKKHFHCCVYEVAKLKAKCDLEINSFVKQEFKYNLLLFDDLTVQNLQDLFQVMKNVTKDKDVRLIFVCIFNIQETDNLLNHRINHDHVNLIETEFKKVGLPQNLAKFYEFSQSEVSAWIVKQLVVKGVNSDSHSQIVENLLNNQDVKYHGLKGLSAKLNLFL